MTILAPVSGKRGPQGIQGPQGPQGETGVTTLDDFDTGDLSEGVNLYFTNERVDDRVSSLIQDGIGLAWTYVDAAGTLTGNVSLSVFDTGDLSEGSNLYFTNERVDDRVSALIQDGAGLTWTYDDGAGLLTGNVSLSSFDTGDLSEGANLYFTNERVDDRVSSLIQDGTGISWSYDDGANTLTPTVSLAAFDTGDLSEGVNLYYTDARARAAISGVSPISYDSSNGQISLDNTKIIRGEELTATGNPLIWNTVNNIWEDVILLFIDRSILQVGTDFTITGSNEITLAETIDGNETLWSPLYFAA